MLRALQSCLSSCWSSFGLINAVKSSFQVALYTFTCSLSLLSRSFRLISSSQVKKRKFLQIFFRLSTCQLAISSSQVIKWKQIFVNELSLITSTRSNHINQNVGNFLLTFSCYSRCLTTPFSTRASCTTVQCSVSPLVFSPPPSSRFYSSQLLLR